jgi:hypothetical protein
MTMDDLEAQLKLIAKYAPDLRKAGVTAAAIGDIEIELAPPDPEPQPAAPKTTEAPDDPLKDSATFGGKIPRRRGDPQPDRDGMSDDDG